MFKVCRSVAKISLNVYSEWSGVKVFAVRIILGGELTYWCVCFNVKVGLIVASKKKKNPKLPVSAKYCLHTQSMRVKHKSIKNQRRSRVQTSVKAKQKWKIICVSVLWLRSALLSPMLYTSTKSQETQASSFPADKLNPCEGDYWFV